MLKKCNYIASRIKKERNENIEGEKRVVDVAESFAYVFFWNFIVVSIASLLSHSTFINLLFQVSIALLPTSILIFAFVHLRTQAVIKMRYEQWRASGKQWKNHNWQKFSPWEGFESASTKSFWEALLGVQRNTPNRSSWLREASWNGKQVRSPKITGYSSIPRRRKRLSPEVSKRMLLVRVRWADASARALMKDRKTISANFRHWILVVLFRPE